MNEVKGRVAGIVITIQISGLIPIAWTSAFESLFPANCQDDMATGCLQPLQWLSTWGLWRPSWPYEGVRDKAVGVLTTTGTHGLRAWPLFLQHAGLITIKDSRCLLLWNVMTLQSARTEVNVEIIAADVTAQVRELMERINLGFGVISSLHVPEARGLPYLGLVQDKMQN